MLYLVARCSRIHIPLIITSKVGRMYKDKCHRCNWKSDTDKKSMNRFSWRTPKVGQIPVY